MSTHYFFIDLDLHMPASCWFNFEAGFRSLCGYALTAFVYGNYYGEGKEDPAPGSIDRIECESPNNPGLTILDYTLENDASKSSLFPMKPGSRMNYSSAGSYTDEIKLSFRENQVEGRRLITTSEGSWNLFSGYHIHAHNNVYIVCDHVNRFQYPPFAKFPEQGFSRQLLFHFAMKPGDTNIVYKYSEGEFYAIVAEGYDDVQTPAGEFLRCLRLRIDSCGHRGKKMEKIFPWDVAPWGKYICGTRFIWLSPGTGMVKYINGNEEPLLLRSIHS